MFELVQQITPIATAVSALLALGLSAWSFLQGPAKQIAAELRAFKAEIAKNRQADRDRMDATVDELDDRLNVVEKGMNGLDATLRQLPTKDDMHLLQLSLGEVRSDQRVQGETLRGVKETSNLMRDWLLERGVK